MQCTVVIDAFPESACRYKSGWAVVAVDVIRAATTAITAVARGRRCFPVSSEEEAMARARLIQNPLLAGERKSGSALAFDLRNSPSAVDRHPDTGRPLVLLSSSGTRLMCAAAGSDAVYLACFRNAAATARHLAEAGHLRVAIIGAGTRDQFREEDQICCGWIARDLVRSGAVPRDGKTAALIRRWQRAQPRNCLSSRSVAFLRRTRQLADLRFVLSHHNDLDAVFAIENGEVAMRAPARAFHSEEEAVLSHRDAVL